MQWGNMHADLLYNLSYKHKLLQPRPKQRHALAQGQIYEFYVGHFAHFA